ncbi:MAG: TlpA family protein disulfide reductase [Rickettsiales bacterium]|nr:TlpA family protein disulfide reductase [Rickettsiales bacterium]
MKFFQLFLALFFLVFNFAEAANPTLIGKTLDGKNFDLKEKRGQILIVNFWATWCIDCRRELPILDEIYKDYQAQGLEIIGVSTDRAKDRKKVLEVTTAKKYVNLLSSDVTKNDFPEVEFLPTSYVIDKDGKLVGEVIVYDRAITKKDFEDALKPLLTN